MSTKSATENAAVFAPTPSAVTTIAVKAKPGARISVRTLKRTILLENVPVRRCRGGDELHDRLHPQRENGERPVRIAPSHHEDRAHLVAILGAERRGEEAQEGSVEAHHALPSPSPCARAIRTISDMRRASARATASPNGVMR